MGWARSIVRGATVPNVATNFAGKAVSFPALPVTSVEYYNAGLDHYFISNLQPDIDALDTGRIAGWARTGQSFRVFPSQASGGAGVNPVCRFYIPPAHGNSHFFSASPAECNSIQQKIADGSQLQRLRVRVTERVLRRAAEHDDRCVPRRHGARRIGCGTSAPTRTTATPARRRSRRR